MPDNATDSPAHTPDVYQLEPFLQRPDWEPLRDAGCVTINGKRIFEITCAQAAFIVRAVNSHAALFDALQGPLRRAKVGEPLTLTPEEIDQAKAAVSAATLSK
jgi:hypothetical protein